MYYYILTTKVDFDQKVDLWKIFQIGAHCHNVLFLIWVHLYSLLITILLAKVKILFFLNKNIKKAEKL